MQLHLDVDMHMYLAHKHVLGKVRYIAASRWFRNLPGKVDLIRDFLQEVMNQKGIEIQEARAPVP